MSILTTSIQIVLKDLASMILQGKQRKGRVNSTEKLKPSFLVGGGGWQQKHQVLTSGPPQHSPKPSLFRQYNHVHGQS